VNKPHSVASPNNLSLTDLTSASIRSQLLWASLFPLLIFGLLTILAMSTVLDRSFLELARQRNTALAQLISESLNEKVEQGTSVSDQDLHNLYTSLALDQTLSLLLVNDQGAVVAEANNGYTDPESGMMVTSAPVAGSIYTVVLSQPEKEILADQRNNQVLMAALILIGVGLSLAMLSLSIGRIILPIRFMSQRASEAIPGSTFTPLRETGPQEIRSLIAAFNKMVIRLAKQQTALRQYSHKALLSQEEERLRLSHELHDGTLQDLVALNQRVELCQHELSDDRAHAHDRLVEIHDLLQNTIADVRRISIALRPPVLEDFGLVAAVDALCKQAGRENPNLTCELHLNGEPRRLSADMELAMFRVIQEALTNIHKHVRNARKVNVEMIFTDAKIATSITNDGGSFTKPDIQGYIKSGHMGLAGMQERAKLFNGTFTIATLDDGRTRITLELPEPFEETTTR
jgi:signal transduction histidine kinase